MPLVGVGMPAHFLVRSADDPNAFFDPFHGPERLDRDGARRLFEEVTNGQAPWRDSYLDPTSNRDIVIRMLNNLKGSFARQSDAVRFAIVMQLRAGGRPNSPSPNPPKSSPPPPSSTERPN